MTSTPKIRAAREVAEFLDSIGEHKRANDIRSVLRSTSSLRETCSRLGVVINSHQHPARDLRTVLARVHGR